MSQRAAMYVRYSSSNQREESIDAQVRAIEEYCKRKGYIVVKIYADEARSATTDDRASFQKMIQESALGIFDILIVHKLDRFARNRYDSAFYKRRLKINKVAIESVLEQLDNSPESIILESVLEGMAEYYSKNLVREVRKGLTENADKAIHNGGRPSYGFRLNPEIKINYLLVGKVFCGQCGSLYNGNSYHYIRSKNRTLKRTISVPVNTGILVSVKTT